MWSWRGRRWLNVTGLAGGEARFSSYVSDLRHATIDEQLDTVDEAGIFGREEHGSPADLARIGDATGGNLRGELLFELAPLIFVAREPL